ncbi:helix-hairpin-helix domain-containing protein [Bacillus sp. FSL K6-3431]|uniref:helix-hairpin-helix domain-containing protein n=1 Tax=Bacillus sp. FSL K6-3431 TaxID=2921500 RepID=UPI0030F59CF1
MKIWFESYKTMFICGIVILIAIFLYYSRPQEQAFSEPINTDMQPLESKPPEANMEEMEENNIRIFVDVKGAVHKPGLYEAVEGERIFDIIGQAGGLLDDADENQINFAEKLHDEMVVHIPKVGEDLDEMPANVNSGTKKDGIININKADSTELESLPGVGPAKAKAIIEYREQNGPYQQIDDLQKISGIGPKSFEKLQDLISVK